MRKRPSLAYMEEKFRAKAVVNCKMDKLRSRNQHINRASMNKVTYLRETTISERIKSMLLFNT